MLYEIEESHLEYYSYFSYYFKYEIKVYSWNHLRKLNDFIYNSGMCKSIL